MLEGKSAIGLPQYGCHWKIMHANLPLWCSLSRSRSGKVSPHWPKRTDSIEHVQPIPLQWNTSDYTLAGYHTTHTQIHTHRANKSTHLAYLAALGSRRCVHTYWSCWACRNQTQSQSTWVVCLWSSVSQPSWTSSPPCLPHWIPHCIRWNHRVHETVFKMRLVYIISRKGVCQELHRLHSWLL